MTTTIRYEDFRAFEGWGRHTERLLLARVFGDRRGARVLEVGAGRNPALSPETVERLGLDYTILDVAVEELDRAGPRFRRLVADISSPVFEAQSTYDVIFSRMTCEHVRRAATFHRNILNVLEPGGRALHFFPTLYALPFRRQPVSAAPRLQGDHRALRRTRWPQGRDLQELLSLVSRTDAPPAAPPGGDRLRGRGVRRLLRSRLLQSLAAARRSRRPPRPPPARATSAPIHELRSRALAEAEYDERCPLTGDRKSESSAQIPKTLNPLRPLAQLYC